VARERIEQLHLLDLVVEQRDAHSVLRVLGGKDVEHVATHAKRAATEIGVVARVLHLGEPANRVALREGVALAHVQNHAVILGRIADTVDRRNGADDHAVGTLEDRLGRRKPHLLDVLVDRAVLLDVEVARRHVRFGLVIVVVADEILDCVRREELAELGIELRGERLVRREHERGTPGASDDVRHRVRLAGTGDAEQRLERETVLQALDELVDRFRLIARGRERLVQLERTVRVRGDHDRTAQGNRLV
jgi:hypothetical protein